MMYQSNAKLSYVADWQLYSKLFSLLKLYCLTNFLIFLFSVSVSFLWFGREHVFHS